jgi:hypothetical protein
MLSHILLQYVRFCMSNNSWEALLFIQGQYRYLLSNIRICPRIQLPVSAQWWQTYVKVQGKMVYKNMNKIVFQSN